MKQIEQYQERIARLQQEATNERNTRVTTTLGSLGFGKDQIKRALAVLEVEEGTPSRARRVSKTRKVGRPKARKARAVITDKTREKVKKLVEQGKTGAEIAEKLDISLPSVANIKKAEGISRPHAVAV